jgi:hypothetical protein
LNLIPQAHLSSSKIWSSSVHSVVHTSSETQIMRQADISNISATLGPHLGTELTSSWLTWWMSKTAIGWWLLVAASVEPSLSWGPGKRKLTANTLYSGDQFWHH